MEQHYVQGPFWKNYYAMIDDVQAALKRGERIELDDNADARTLGYVSALNRWTISLAIGKEDVIRSRSYGAVPTARQKLINELMKSAKTRLKMCTEILPAL